MQTIFSLLVNFVFSVILLPRDDFVLGNYSAQSKREGKEDKICAAQCKREVLKAQCLS